MRRASGSSAPAPSNSRRRRDDDDNDDADDDSAGETNDEQLARPYAGARVPGRRHVLGLGRQCDPVDHQQPAGRRRSGSRRIQRAACCGADGLRDPDTAPNRARPPWRWQCDGPLERGDQPGQPSLGQCGAGRRPGAPGAEPEIAIQLPHAVAGQCAARGARERGSTAGGHRRWRRAGAFCREPEPFATAAQGHRFPARPGRHRPHRCRVAEQPGRGRHPAAGADAGGGVPALQLAREPASTFGRHRLRHPSDYRLDVPER